MTLRPQKPIPKPKKQVQVDLKNAETMKCAKCGNSIFIQVYVIKRISDIVSPTGQEVIAPVQVFNCGNCGTMLPLGDVDELV